MIWGTSFAAFSYGFACKQVFFWKWLWIIKNFVCCLVAVVVTLSPTIKSKKVNAIAFLIAGYSLMPGLLHLHLYSDERYVYRFGMWWWLSGGLFYGVGAIIYALRFPERYFRRSFDTFGSSHQIFHVCVLIAAGIHVWGMVKVFHERQLFRCPPFDELN